MPTVESGTTLYVGIIGNDPSTGQLEAGSLLIDSNTGDQTFLPGQESADGYTVGAGAGLVADAKGYSLSDTTITAGGAAFVDYGATADNTTLSGEGASLTVVSGDPQTQGLTGGTASISNTTVSDEAVLFIGLTTSDPAYSGPEVATGTKIEPGGIVEIADDSTGDITFEPIPANTPASAGLEYIAFAGDNKIAINGFGPGDLLVYGGPEQGTIQGVSYDNGVLSVTTSDQGVVTMPVVGNYTTSDFEVVQGGLFIQFATASLFTSGADNVDFNHLTSTQQSAVAGGADLYHGQGGADVVVLPNVANYDESVGNGQTLGWNASQTFVTGSQAGDIDSVTGGDGNYNIALGAGADTVTITGNGNNAITDGSGAATITIAGNGTNTITGGAGTATITLSGGGTTTFMSGSGDYTITLNGAGTLTVDDSSGSGGAMAAVPPTGASQTGPGEIIDLNSGGGKVTIDGASLHTVNASGGVDTVNIASAGTNAIIFSASNTTVNLSLKSGVGQVEYINGFNNTDTLNIVGFGAVTLSAAFNSDGVTNPGEVDLYSGTDQVATLIFDSSTNVDQLEPGTTTANGSQATAITLDSTPGPQDPTGSNINWSFIHGWETYNHSGTTVLAPYISINDSGLTLAQGVDLGGQKDFNLATVFPGYQSNPNLQFVSQFINVPHAEAVSLLNPSQLYKGNPTSLSVSVTTTQANALTYYFESTFLNQLSHDYTAAAAEYDNGGWDTLSAAQQTAIFDLAWNIGLHRNPPVHYGIEDLSLWDDLAQDNWAVAVQKMAHTGGDPTRQLQDAGLLLQGNPLPFTIEAGQSVASNPLTGAGETSYDFAIADTTTQYAVDPSGPDLELTLNAGSPLIASLQLPEGNASGYLVSYETGSTWSAAQQVAPDATLSFAGADVDGLKVVMLDGSIDPINGAPDFTFYLRFASAGAFSGAVTSSFPGDHNFNGDGVSDLLIENTGGAVVVGEVEGVHISYATVGALGPEWSFKGTGDLLGDGSTAFLIENTAGAVVVGEVASGGAVYIPVGALGSEWSFVATGDFLGHGDDQFLIENTAGAVVVGEVVNGHAQYTQVAGLGSEWKFAGAGDFLGDGVSDFLIQNSAGAVAVGEVANGQAQYTTVASLGPEWKFVGAGDFLGDGLADFMIENTSGAVFLGEVVNGHAQYTQVAALGSEWKFVGAGDYLGEGHDQFLIENSAGAIDIGDWANGAIHYTQVTALGPEWTFH